MSCKVVLRLVATDLCGLGCASMLLAVDVMASFLSKVSVLKVVCFFGMGFQLVLLDFDQLREPDRRQTTQVGATEVPCISIPARPHKSIALEIVRAGHCCGLLMWRESLCFALVDALLSVQGIIATPAV
jgi:hypothetical protein